MNRFRRRGLGGRAGPLCHRLAADRFPGGGSRRRGRLGQGVPEAAELYAERRKILLSGRQRLVKRRGGVLQIKGSQRDLVIGLVHPGAKQFNRGRQIPGMIRHPGLLLIGLLLQAKLGGFRLEAGFHQDAARLNPGLLRHGGGRLGSGGRFRRRGRHFVRLRRFGGFWRSGAPLGDHGLHLVHLLLQVAAFELPFQDGLLAFPVAVLQGAGPLLSGLGTGCGGGSSLFRRLGALCGAGQVALELIHAGTCRALLGAQLFVLRLEPVNLLLIFAFPLLGLVGKGVHICQHIVLVKPPEAGAKPLFLQGLYGWFLAGHGAPPQLASAAKRLPGRGLPCQW